MRGKGKHQIHVFKKKKKETTLAQVYFSLPEFLNIKRENKRSQQEKYSCAIGHGKKTKPNQKETIKYVEKKPT